MKRVTGIGGIFFKCNDQQLSKQWYERHLGIRSDAYGGCFEWHTQEGAKGHTVWSPFTADTQYFSPSKAAFMVNYRVENLVDLLIVLRDEGVEVVGDMEENEFGKFAWILDPNGIKLELWEPPKNFSELCSVVQASE